MYLFLITFIYFVCLWLYASTCMYIWRSEDNLWKGDPPTSWVLMIKLGSSCLMINALTPFQNLHLFICVCVEVRGHLVGVRFSLLLFRSQLLNSLHQAWPQESLTTKLSYWLMKNLLQAGVGLCLSVCGLACVQARGCWFSGAIHCFL